MSQQGSGARTELSHGELGKSLLAGVFQLSRMDMFDWGLQFDANLAALRDRGALTSALDVLARWSEAATDDAAADAVLTPNMHGGVQPDGRGPRDFIAQMARRAREAQADPSILPSGHAESVSDVIPTRMARWTLAVGDENVRSAVTQPHLDAIERWLQTPVDAGWQRQHLHTSLASTLGVVGEVAPIATSDLGPPTPEWEAAESVSCAVMTIRREVVAGHGTGRFEVLHCRPEVALESGVRELFPDLCHFYGGYFGHEFSDEMGWPIELMTEAMLFTRGEARDRLREQLSTLLGHSNSDVRFVLDQCGSWAVPHRARHWVDRTLWRLDAYDWGDESH